MSKTRTDDEWLARTIFYVECGLDQWSGATQFVERAGAFSMTVRSPSPEERRASGAPDGVVVVVDRGARTIEGTFAHAREEAREIAGMIAVAGGVELRAVVPLVMVDATPNAPVRRFRQFHRVRWTFPTMPRGPQNLAFLIQALLKFGAAHGRKSARERVEDALFYIGRSLNEPDALTAFSFAWLAFERLDPLMSERLQPSPRQVVCPSCSHAFPDPKPPEPWLPGIRHFVEHVLADPNLSKQLREVRNGVQHGRDGLDDAEAEVAKIGADSRVREVAIRAIGKLLGFDTAWAEIHRRPHFWYLGGTIEGPELGGPEAPFTVFADVAGVRLGQHDDGGVYFAAFDVKAPQGWTVLDRGFIYGPANFVPAPL